MRRIVFLVADTVNVLAATCALILALLGTADVIGTFFFNAPISGTVEYSGMLLACLFFLGMSATVRGRNEISVDVLLNALPDSARRVVGGVNRIASVFFLGVLSYATWGLTIHSYERATVATGAQGFRLWPFEAIAATGASIAFLCLIARLFQRDTGEEET